MEVQAISHNRHHSTLPVPKLLNPERPGLMTPSNTESSWWAALRGVAAECIADAGMPPANGDDKSTFGRLADE